MALPGGLIPVFAFVLTVGFAVPVVLGARLAAGGDDGSFASALRAALVEAGVLYLVGVLAVWSIAGGLELWEVAVTLLLTGVMALGVLVVLPLVVGQQVIQHVRAVDADTALRFSAYGWPIAMVVVFGIFIAPGGFARGDLLSLGGNKVCLAGFCGVSLSLALALVVEFAVAVFAPGVIGAVLYARFGTPGGHRTSSSR